MLRVIVLGSTGSIGRQTIEVAQHLNELHGRGESSRRIEVVGLSAGANGELLASQARELGVKFLGLCDASATFEAPAGAKVFRGADAAEQLVRSVDADMVVGAIVGSAGLPATLAAIERGMDIALANKETLVAAGALVIPMAREKGVRLLPVDSEHSAVWQCLPEDHCPPCQALGAIGRILLTASGGPFRTWSKEAIESATVEQALAHPTWSMGAKVTVDSASLTNKALEVIEAHWLFGVPGERIDVMVHPQSIVHSLVEFVDGSIVAQLGAPDMRTPIQLALTWPERAGGCSDRVDWSTLSALDFEPPDLDRFPALGLAYEAIEAGGVAGAILNAANERAVEAFLAGEIPFGEVSGLTGSAVRSLVARGEGEAPSLEQIMAADAEGRRFVEASLRPARAVAGSLKGR